MTRQRREAILQRAVLEAVALTHHFRAIEVDQNPVPGGGYQAMTGHPDLEIIGGKHLKVKEDRTFYVELKTATGRLSPKQIEWHERATDYGASVYVCRSRLEVLKLCFEKNERYGWTIDDGLDNLLRQLL